MAYIVMAYVIMAYRVMAYIVMAYIVMAYTVMACIVGLYSYGFGLDMQRQRTPERCHRHLLIVLHAIVEDSTW